MIDPPIGVPIPGHAGPHPGQLSPHFHLAEFACKDGHCVPDELLPNLRRLVAELEKLRVAIGRPIVIMSGYRTPAWNAGRGVDHSRHLTAEAADIRVASMSPTQVGVVVEDMIRVGALAEGGVGLYLPNARRRLGWVHYDVRGTRARWRG